MLLDEVLKENGMNRGHVYMCNVLKCRAANLENGRWMNRPPRVDEAAACRAWLDAQLEIIRPLVIVCIGGPAANALIHPSFAITRERGIWFNNSPYATWTWRRCTRPTSCASPVPATMRRANAWSRTSAAPAAR